MAYRRISYSYPHNDDRVLRIAYPSASIGMLVAGIVELAVRKPSVIYSGNTFPDIVVLFGMTFLFFLFSGFITVLGDGNSFSRKSCLIGTAVVSVVFTWSAVNLVEGMRSGSENLFSHDLIATLFYGLVLTRRIINIRKRKAKPKVVTAEKTTSAAIKSDSVTTTEEPINVKHEKTVKAAKTSSVSTIVDEKRVAPASTIQHSDVWICPDCGEENEDSVCKGCGRIWRGDEKTRTRMARSEDKNAASEKTPGEEKSSITGKKSTPAEAVIAKEKTEPKRSEIIYFDKDEKITTKDKAVHAVIHEYDEHGNLARTVWGNITREDEDEEPSTLETIIAEIRKGLTGDPAKDKDYLNQQIERYREHPDHHEIIKECGRLLFTTLTESEKNEWAEAMHADDQPAEKTKDSRPFLILKRRKNGETIRVEQPVTILGKDSDSDIQLHSPKADEANAVILLKDNLWFAANDFSLRALTVNGKKVQPGERRPLKKGDIISIAEVETFEIAECVNGV